VKKKGGGEGGGEGMYPVLFNLVLDSDIVVLVPLRMRVDHLWSDVNTQGQEGEAAAEETKKSNHVQRKLEKHQQERTLDPHIEEQFGSGRLLACISSRPGQCGRADG
jgi:uncharacterized spore protein YtfJ